MPFPQGRHLPFCLPTDSASPIALPPRRVIAICAGLKPLVLKDEVDAAMFSRFGDVRDLPTGRIVALVLMGVAYKFDPKLPQSQWAFGEWCHPILDSVRVSGDFVHKGNLGLTPLTSEASAAIADDDLLQAKLLKWGASGAKIMGLTVRQPAAEAIASGEKDVENRPKQLFRTASCDIDQ
jgi:hypothetical protein